MDRFEAQSADSVAGRGGDDALAAICWRCCALAAAGACAQRARAGRDLRRSPRRSCRRRRAQTIALIRKGGPFPYERDGVVVRQFREAAARCRARGYYREYTVRTPGAKNRGARRIVAGRGGELYYTDDHYSSFKRITEP